MQETSGGYTFHNRDISWLAFNHRVLLEAMNDRLPVYERIKFLSIYHSNLDEFFRVRVAYNKSMADLPAEERAGLDFDPKSILEEIYTIVEHHYSKLDDYFYHSIIPELKENGIRLLNEKNLGEQQKEFLTDFAQSNILPFIQPSILEKGKITSFLKNRALYLGIQLKDKEDGALKYAFVEVPVWKTDRFIEFPRFGETYDYIILDDAVRFLLPKIFPGYEIISINSFMVNRDAELYLEDELSGNILDKIKRSLARRESGLAIGFIFDRRMSLNMLKYLIQSFGIEPESVIVGSKYLKMSDFMSFPNPLSPDLEDETWKRLGHRNFDKYDSIFDAIKAKDRLLSFPYQKFDYVTRILSNAVDDDRVTDIDMTLYRTSERSKIARLLIQAARKGKKITAFVELKARFDEESNIAWAQEMRSAGVNVIYSLPKIKVHSKLLLITRGEHNHTKHYGLISTGNFNRNTAKIYCDHALITANSEITNEIVMIFDMLKSQLKTLPDYKHLLVAPHQLRNKFYQFIDFEIEQAKQGKKAKIFIKVNSIEDKEMIEKLYEASNAGVKIKMIVRGVCGLVAGVKGQSENIQVKSIIDRFLEHARIFKFHNAGQKRYFMGSADLMRRNLSKRVEVVTPIYEPDVARQLNKILKLQWKDNVKARWLDQQLSDQRVKTNGKAVQSQKEIHKYFKNLLSGKVSY